MANLKNITNWVWGCTLSNGDECPGEKTGGIKGYNYQEREGYLFLYTVDIDDNVIYPDSGRWYKFARAGSWPPQFVCALVHSPPTQPVACPRPGTTESGNSAR